MAYKKATKTPEGDILLCNDVDLNARKRTPVVMKAKILDKKTIGFADMTFITKNIGDSLYNRALMYLMPYVMLSGMNEDGLAIGIAAAKGSCTFTRRIRKLCIHSRII